MNRDLTRRSVLSLSAAAIGGLHFGQRSFAFEKDTAWPSWRGPNRDGVCSNAKFPRSLESVTRLWSVDLQDSYSGPILSEDLVFTTETVDKRDETLIALDRNSGEQVWRQQWAGAMTVPFFAKSNGDWIRSTPATDGDCIVVGGMRDVVACFEATSGEERWRIDFVKDHGASLPSFGLVCSPLIDGDYVYIQAGGGLRKIALADGSLIWEALPDSGGMSGGAFSSPMISTLHGVRQLVVQTRTTLGGIDLESGNVLWKKEIASFRGMNILTPVVWNDQVFTSCYGGRSQLLKLTPGAGEWQVDTAWESKAEAYMSSPVVVGGHLYMHLRNQRACCIDLSTGEETWRTTPFGKYWSMLTDGQIILALDEVGELILYEANSAEFTLLDRRTISDEPSWAYIAMVEGKMFIRRQHGLDAYRWA